MLEIRWKPDPSLADPVYEQIAAYLTARIVSGAWPVDAELPTQRELASLLGVNRSTVVAALELLKQRGLVETGGKRGTRVGNGFAGSDSQPDWALRIREGVHRGNVQTIQQINRLETVPGMLRLSSGELAPRYQPVAALGRVLAGLAGELQPMGYEHPRGNPELRAAVARYLETIGIEAPDECILIVSGALQAIQLLTLGLLQPGSMVLMERPSYLYSLNILPSMGMRRYGIPVDADGMKVSLLDQVRLDESRALIYVNPDYQNPTGAVLSEMRRAALLARCARDRIPVVEDEVYRELWFGRRPPPPLKARDDQGLVLHVGSVSKTLSPGLRIGWVVGPESVIDRLSDLKMQADYGSSSLSQLAVARWLDSDESVRHTESLRARLLASRDVALTAMDRYFGDLADWSVPLGGFYLWAELRVPVRLTQVFEEAVRQGVLFYPGYLYDPEPNQFMRLSYSYASPEELEEGIKRLADIVRKLERGG